MYLKGICVVLSVFLIVGCAGPKAAFEVKIENSEVPASVSFVNKSEKAEAFFWDFGNGFQSEEKDPVYRFLQSGKHKITLTAKGKKRKNMTSTEIYLEPSSKCLVEMKTTEGTMLIQLFDDTPLHRDNFIKLAETGYYKGLLFHRVINGFMIQGGDPDSRDAVQGKRLGMGGPNYKVPAEFSVNHVHIKGALAAARQGDAVNPKKESSGSQFYIVHGKPVPENQIQGLEFQKNIKYSEENKNLYTTVGGTPFLDMDYTVFGTVVEGLEVIDKIAQKKTDPADRPVEDVRIIEITVIR